LVRAPTPADRFDLDVAFVFAGEHDGAGDNEPIGRAASRADGYDSLERPNDPSTA
jgi:hypothetical protein